MSEMNAPPTFEHLLQHADWLHALARAVVRDDAVAEDLVQETWLSALRAPPRNPLTVRAWLRRVLKRHAYQRHRAEIARVRRESAAARATEAPGASDLVARTEVQARVIQAVLDLEEPFRTTVLLRYVEGLPPRDVAARTGAPVETVRARLRRARERLRERFDREDARPGAWLGALLPLVVPAGRHGATGVTAAWTTGVLAMTAKKTVVVVVVGLLALLAYVALDANRTDRRRPVEVETASQAEDAPSRRRVAPRDDGESRAGAISAAADDAEPPETASPATDTIPSATVDVTLVTRDGDPPASGVAVTIWRERPAPRATLALQSLDSGAARTLDVSALVPADQTSRLVVAVDDPRYVPVGDTVHFDPSAGTTPRSGSAALGLTPAVPVAGRVVDTSGEPIADAVVGLFRRMPGKQPNERVDATRTGPDGTFRLRAVPGEDLVLAAAAASRLPLLREIAGSQAARVVDDVALPGGAAIRGRVVRDGAPVPGILVRAHPGYGRAYALGALSITELDDDAGASQNSPSAVTDEDGAFELQGLRERAHDVSIDPPGCTPDFRTALRRSARPGADEVVFDISACELVIHVTDAAGNAVAVDVLVRPGGRGTPARAPTDAGGIARVRARRGAAYTVEIRDDRFRVTVEDVQAPVGAERHDVRLVATPAN